MIFVGLFFVTATMFFYDNDVFFLTTTETTGTTRRTDATAGCHEVTYNWDNKITVGSLFFRKLKGSAAGVMKLSDAVGLICKDLSDAVGLFSKDFFDAVGEMRLFIF